MEEQGDRVRTDNKRASNYAAGVYLARLEERFNIDGAAQISGMVTVGQSMNAANVDERVTAENIMRKEKSQEKNNAMHRRQRNAKRNKRSLHLQKSTDVIFLEPLRLIVGRDIDLIQDDNHSHDQHIAWEHRTILGQAARSVQ